MVCQQGALATGSNRPEVGSRGRQLSAKALPFTPYPIQNPNVAIRVLIEFAQLIDLLRVHRFMDSLLRARRAKFFSSRPPLHDVLI
jgi:hypothetical protein